MSAVLPPGVSVVETRTPSLLALEPLLQAEEALLGPRAGIKRRQDFTLGRACARRALAQLGWPVSAILSGNHRQPLWPPGIVGSITHCSGYCAAAVARAADVIALGIDVEENLPLPIGVISEVCSETEQAQLRLLPETGIHWPSVVFSAKESIYKAWFPLTGRWLGFEDVSLTVQPDQSVFQAELLLEMNAVPSIWPPRIAGRFLVNPERIFTAVTLRNPHKGYAFGLRPVTEAVQAQPTLGSTSAITRRVAE